MQYIIDNLQRVEASLRAVADAHADGSNGYLSPAWGFATPPTEKKKRLGGKFHAWEDKLDAIPSFFPPLQVYEYFETHPFATELPADLCQGKWPKLQGNKALHAFLKEPPIQTVSVTQEDIQDYQTAHRILMLIATLAHMYSNSADEPASVLLPAWMEEPLLLVSKRMDVQPSLTTQLAQIDNWMWKNDNSTPQEFRMENLTRIYPNYLANRHDDVFHLTTTLMGYRLRRMPFDVMKVLTSLADLLILYDNNASMEQKTSKQLELIETLHRMASDMSACKEAFQTMTTDPQNRNYCSKYVFAMQVQPVARGTLVRCGPDPSTPVKMQGYSGLQFSYFHILDGLLGRYQRPGLGEIASLAQEVYDFHTKPERDYLHALSQLEPPATLFSLMEKLATFDPTGTRPLLAAYNYLLECFIGEGGMLAAHARKMFSYMHNNLQSDTTGGGGDHVGGDDTKGDSEPNNVDDPKTDSVRKRMANHGIATQMFRAICASTEERRQLFIPPLMTKVHKKVYTTSESGSFATVALDITDAGLYYEYGDVVRVLLPLDERAATDWTFAFADSVADKALTLHQLPHDGGTGWSWADLFKALGWSHTEPIPLRKIMSYVEKANVSYESEGSRWITNPFDLNQSEDIYGLPPSLTMSQIKCLVPVSPRVYSVCGVEKDRVFILVSKPRDNGRHHGYERMVDPAATEVRCSFSPRTHFALPPEGVNLVCIASGTGISPFVGLAAAIGSRAGSYTIIHQCRSSDMLLANASAWLSFTSSNPGAYVIGYVSGDGSHRNLPMQYHFRNGKFDRVSVLGTCSTHAYYHACPIFRRRLAETYELDGLNLAYCCGGKAMVLDPLNTVATENDWIFEAIIESYASGVSYAKTPEHCFVGGVLVDLNPICPAHPGSDQIIHQTQRLEREKVGLKQVVVPELSDVFFKLHPDGYNLLRCLRAPEDAQLQEFTRFLDRQAPNVLEEVREQYAQAALAFPEHGRVTRIALQLEAVALQQLCDKQTVVGETQAASIDHHIQRMQLLLNHTPGDDEDVCSWRKILEVAEDSRRQRRSEEAGT